LIVKRKGKVDRLGDGRWVGRVIGNLFLEQKRVLRGMKRAKEQADLQEVEALVKGQDRDEELLRQALMAGNPENFIKRKK